MEFFYSNKDIETLYTTLEKIVLIAIRTHAPLRKVYKRNDKPLFLAQKFVCATTRQLQIKKEHLLDNEISDKLLNTRNQLNSKYKKYFEKFKKQLIESNSSSRIKWNVINEVRNFKRIATKVDCLKNSFGTHNK